VQDRRERFGNVALLIGIVNAQDELAAVPARIKPVEKSGPDTADVKIACRTWSKSRSNHKG
jgi:hypothetical protein